MEYILFTPGEECDVQVIYDLMAKLDILFIPPLSSRIDLHQYARKIAKCANMILALDGKENIVGILAFYSNDKKTKIGFITLLGVLPQCQGLGVATNLLKQCVSMCTVSKLRKLEVKTEIQNEKAINFYQKNGFKEVIQFIDSDIEKIKFCLEL